jgi:hypothetical protein
MGDGAGWIGLGGILEDVASLIVPERVLITHAAVEPPLRHLVAGRREVHGAETLIDIFLRACCRNAGHPREPRGDDRQYESDHGGLLVSGMAPVGVAAERNTVSLSKDGALYNFGAGRTPSLHPDLSLPSRSARARS